MADWIPFVSQAKSFLQLAFGDSQGALKTQKHFSQQCPLISQGRSLIELIFVSKEAAARTQIECLKTLGGLADSIPVVGHLKGGVHFLLGDKERSYKSVKAATRTAFSLAGGVSGFALGGPPGAIAGGLLGATATDAYFTVLDSAIDGKYTPNGFFAELTDVAKIPTDAGKWFDLGFILVADCATGYFAAKAFNTAKTATVIRSFESLKNALIKKVGPQNTKYLMDAADQMKKKQETLNISVNKTHVSATVIDLDEGNKTYTNDNQQIRNICIRKEKNMSEIELQDIGGKTHDYSANKDTPTHFEKKVPGVQPAIEGRSPRTCAEPASYDEYYKEKPNGNPGSTVVVCVKRNAKSKVIRAVKRCENCLAYAQGMGFAPGDLVDGYAIPEDPGYGNETVRSQVGKGVKHVISGSVLPSQVSDKKTKGSNKWQHHKTNTLKQRKKLCYKPLYK